jgi:serine/threonine protein kinase
MDEELEDRAIQFAARYHLKLRQSLGSGIHGIVYRVKDNAGPRHFALKFHRDKAAYERERNAYRRLAEHGIVVVGGFNVPQMLSCNDEWLVIAMTIVQQPFALDFASAHLDRSPDFSLEALAYWEEEKREQFGARWPIVQQALQELKDVGVLQTDVSPGNFGFSDSS